jgi:multidrug efflux pump subunit AcrA (membrane-fusion protein)
MLGSVRYLSSRGIKLAGAGALASVLLSYGAVGWSAPGDSNGGPGLKIENCKVSAINDIEVPAEEPGPILKLHVAKEAVVKKDQVLAQMDDRLAKAQLEAATAKYKAAAEQAKNDINERYAIKAAEHAKAEYDKSVQATRQTAQAVAEIDVKRFKLAWEKAVLMAEQAVLEQTVATHTAAAQAAEAQAAKLAIIRRQLKSPVDGVVVEIPKKVGEWAAAGDPVVRILQMDKLHVQGMFNAFEYSADKIRGSQVTIEVKIGGQMKKFPGKVTEVDLEASFDGDTMFWAEIDNRQENGEWLLRPGMMASEMIVHTDFVPPPATARKSRFDLE